MIYQIGNCTCLVFGGNLRNDLDNGALELLNADILKDYCSLREQSHISSYFLTLLNIIHMFRYMFKNSGSIIKDLWIVQF